MQHRSIPTPGPLRLVVLAAVLATGALALAAPAAGHPAAPAGTPAPPAATTPAGLSRPAVGDADASTAKPATAAMRRKIVKIAKDELADRRHNHEIGGYNCNFYSTALGAGHRSCTNGWRSEAWCADFARWVWKRAGADTHGLSAAVSSFHTYGVKHHTWNSGASTAGVQRGDAAVYRHPSHVGIVIAVDHGKITVISGNSGRDSKHVWKSTFKPNNATIAGYTAPVR
jgi:CHAP domain-containing protein